MTKQEILIRIANLDLERQGLREQLLRLKLEAQHEVANTKQRKKVAKST